VWTWDERVLERAGAEAILGTQIAGTQQAVENADAWMNNYRGTRWVCGYRQRRGRGAIVQIGLPANAALVRAAHRWMGAPLYAQAEHGGVRTSVARRGKELFLFATNLNDADVRTRIHLDGVKARTRATVTDLFTGRREQLEASVPSVVVPRRSGGAWRIDGS
jgi:hypothetical protein